MIVFTAPQKRSCLALFELFRATKGFRRKYTQKEKRNSKKRRLYNITVFDPQQIFP